MLSRLKRAEIYANDGNFEAMFSELENAASDGRKVLRIIPEEFLRLRDLLKTIEMVRLRLRARTLQRKLAASMIAALVRDAEDIILDDMQQYKVVTK